MILCHENNQILMKNSRIIRYFGIIRRKISTFAHASAHAVAVNLFVEIRSGELEREEHYILRMRLLTLCFWNR